MVIMKKSIFAFAFIAMLMTIGCSNTEKPKLVSKLDSYSKMIDEMAAQLDGAADVAAFDQALTDSIAAAGAIAQEIEAANLKEEDKKEVMGLLYDAQIKAFTLKMKVLEKQNLAAVAGVDAQKAELTAKLEALKASKAKTAKDSVLIVTKQLQDLDSNISVLNAEAAKKVEALQAEMANLQVVEDSVQ